MLLQNPQGCKQKSWICWTHRGFEVAAPQHLDDSDRVLAAPGSFLLYLHAITDDLQITSHLQRANLLLTFPRLPVSRHTSFNWTRLRSTHEPKFCHVHKKENQEESSASAETYDSGDKHNLHMNWNVWPVRALLHKMHRH